MASFVISNLDASEFTFENINFKKLVCNNSYYLELKKRWQDDYNATFTAVADDNLVVAPIIKNQGLLGVVDDICLLLSLVQSKFIYCPEYIMGEKPTQTHYDRGHYYRVGKPTAGKWVNDDKIEPFLNSAVKILRESEFGERSGFIAASYYLLVGDSDEIGEVSFILPWMALETLANAYAEKDGISTILHSNNFKEIVKPAVIEVLNQLEKEERLTAGQKELIISKLPELNRPSIRYKICKLRDAYGWDFITNRLLGDYIELRDNLMHLGTLGGVKLARVQDLSIKLHLSMYLALINLIGCSEYISNLDSLKIQIKGN
ncbi:hypothetical protein ACFLW1_01925 [Chloroflexota bacterium]